MNILHNFIIVDKIKVDGEKQDILIQWKKNEVNTYRVTLCATLKNQIIQMYYELMSFILNMSYNFVNHYKKIYNND